MAALSYPLRVLAFSTESRAPPGHPARRELSDLRLYVADHAGDVTHLPVDTPVLQAAAG
jgi:hypothetical protein